MTAAPPVERRLFVDSCEFRVAFAEISGLQVRALAAISQEYELVLEGHGTAPDTPVSDEQLIDLTGEAPRLFTHPPTTFGNETSAAI